MTLRSTTNLVVPKNLQLPRKDLKAKFLYVYNKGYVGAEPVFMTKLWASTVFPTLVSDPTFGKNRKRLRMWASNFSKNMPAGLLDIRKIQGSAGGTPTSMDNAPHFEASVPVMEFGTSNPAFAMSNLARGFTEIRDEVEPDRAEADNLKSRLEENVASAGPNNLSHTHFNAETIINNLKGLDARGRAELQQCLKGVRIVSFGPSSVVYVDFYISVAEAQQLTTSPWLEIRPIDLYPLLLQWVAGCFGFSSDTPLASFPVSKIARTLPQVREGDARVNDNNLSIGPDGTPYWLPRTLDNTSRYEDLYTQAAGKDDGGFRLVDLQASIDMNVTPGDASKGGLPKNIPVLIDWVNNKFSYTTTTGTLKVQDLTRFKTADDSHLHNILTRQGFDAKAGLMMLNMAASSGVDMSFKLTEAEAEAIDATLPGALNKISQYDNMLVYFPNALLYHRKVEEMDDTDPIPLSDISVDGPAFLRPLARIIVKAYPAVMDNIEAVNMKYAVSTVSVNLALMCLIAKYGTNFPEVTMKANAIRSAADQQEVTPGWEPPSIPLLSDRIGFLPHQKKVRNLLKGSPDLAIVPVQAGGGKSVLSITDILYEIKANTSSPYLILCPPHLVAQYVKEIVFFTSGKLNAVAINSYTIKRNGFERLTKMLETAPRNTVVVADYDVLRKNQQQICYGTTTVPVYPIIEFLRQFGFGYAMLDESHSVKNDTARTRACMALIADIPKKRLASGTMAHDSPSDLALQVAMLDPTLFGSRTEFNERYGDVIRGERVMKWKPGAQQEIMRTIKSRIVVAGAMRKEWAALLPQAREEFLGVHLTPAQYEIYNAIFATTIAKLQELAGNNKSIAKFLGLDKAEAQVTKAEGEDESAAVDEEDDEDLAGLLNPYLARLEQFITAPAQDETGNQVLKGDDRISPKVLKIIERIKLHLDKGIKGKVLVFTNYTASAEEIFNLLPPDIKAQALLYVAADKVETGARFENDDRVRVMIGVEQSMNTGLNLQFVSRLIRVETVWNPGTLEQGNSRVNRPELKKVDRRDEIYYDWVVADRTIDITKISRLISKVIAIAKFENTDNHAYAEIPEVPVIKMDLESIQALNSWSGNLTEYAEAYKEYKTVQADDYREYREKHGELKLEALAAAPTPPDAKLMVDVPYTPGLDIYNAGEMGLVRIDEYLRQDAETGLDDESETESDEDEADDKSKLTPAQQLRAEQAEKLKGQAVHTEYGDGIIKSVAFGAKFVNVLLPSGYLARVKFSATFLITRPNTSTKDIRNQLLKAVGEIPLTAPLDVPAEKFKVDNAAMRKNEKEAAMKVKVAEQRALEKSSNLSVELTFSVSNGFLGITYFCDEDQPAAKNALQALGFRPTPQFTYAQVKTHVQLVKQFNMWEAEGFTLDKASIGENISGAFQDLFKILKLGRLANRNVNFNFSNRNQLKNFYRQEVKPSTNEVAIKPYPMIEDGMAYIVLPLRGQASTKKATKVRAPGIKWQMSPDSLVFYALNLEATSAVIKKILAAGIQVANIQDLKVQFKKLHKVNIRNEEEGGIHL